MIKYISTIYKKYMLIIWNVLNTMCDAYMSKDKRSSSNQLHLNESAVFCRYTFNFNNLLNALKRLIDTYAPAQKAYF